MTMDVYYLNQFEPLALDLCVQLAVFVFLPFIATSTS